MRRIVIVGGVAAGPAAAVRAKKIDPNAVVMLLEQGEHIAYGVCELPYLVSGEISDTAVLRPYDATRFARNYGVEVRVFNRVEEVVPARRELAVRDLFRGPVEVIPYDRLILATGSYSTPLGLAGERAPNVFRMKSLDDAQSLCRWIDGRRPATAVIVGGGYIGMETAEALRLRGCGVTVVESAVGVLHDMDESLSKHGLDILRRHGINVQTETRVVELAADAKGNVGKVVTNNGSLPSDIVVITAGVTPETSLAEQAGARVGELGGVRCDARQETTVSGIFAAGDCCEVRDAATSRWSYMPLATIAARQGRVAGENVAGGSAECKDAVRAVGIRLFETDLVQVGATVQQAKEAGIAALEQTIESTDRVPFLKHARPTSIRLVTEAQTGRMLGGSVVGGPGSAQTGTMISLAVHERLTSDAFMRLDHVYAPPMSPFKDPVAIAARRLHAERTDR